MTDTSIETLAPSVSDASPAGAYGSPPDAYSSPPDVVCAAAVDVARAAAQEVAGVALVGDHVDVEADADRIVTHFFACTDRAYTDWRWAVTVVRAPRSKTVTVDEVVLLPGTGALLAPAWVPWSARLQAGDLGVGDVLPTAVDDERLIPGYAAVGPHDVTDEPETIDALIDELWLGRVRVLSVLGRDEAAERWYDGEHGPQAPIARGAELACASCGFMVLMRGALSRVFGVCANEYAPDDGRVVSFDHGCGAHSEALVLQTEPLAGDVAAGDVVPDDVVPDDEIDVIEALDDAEVAEADAPELVVLADEAGSPDHIELADEAGSH